MNPIYKFELTANGTTQRAFPIYKDDLAKDFEKESGQEFFRAKLSGNLTFQSDDYAFIVSQSFDTQFVLEIFISYNAGQSWTSYWRGTFWKTDCDFDDDAESVVVQPTVWDQYNDVLAGIDKEYNLIELAPEIVPVKADKRPVIQIYVLGQSVVGCFLSGMWWEQEATPVNDINALTDQYYFAFIKSWVEVAISGNTTPTLPSSISGEGFRPDSPDVSKLIQTDDIAIEYYRTPVNPDGMQSIVWRILMQIDGTWVNKWQYTTGLVPTADLARYNQFPYSVTLSPVSEDVTGNVTLTFNGIMVFGRYVCDTPTIVTSGSTLNTYDIPTDDIVENNRNYHYVIGYNAPDTIIFSTVLVSTPTQWGLYQPGQYYFNPADNPMFGLGEAFPVARSAWGRVSIWFVFSLLDWDTESSARQPFTIRYAYPISSVISVLLAKIAPGITHAGTTDYSQFLYGTNLIGITQTLLITPKSNLVTAGYDQPAQKAPITLKNVTDMLRDCFRCYWFIDAQNRFRVEHIQYFHNGGSYSGSPVVGIDLTTQKVPRNGKEWAFARNQYKFDKPEMAARYQFGWMDDVTQLFEGYPIDIISKYVNPDNIEQIDISKFTSDIDYILLNPGEISKDGFVLLAALKDRRFQNSAYADSSSQIRFECVIDGNFAAGETISVYMSDASNILRNNNATIRDDSDNSIGVALGGRTTVITLTQNTSKIVVTKNVGGIIGNGTISIIVSKRNVWELPYINFGIYGTDHILQNAFVAFIFLQQYYAFDMPAYQYVINGEQMYAYGIKKLKYQTLRFPVLNDPDLVQLVKTNLGNGTIEKLSVNLTSRNANATLKYDTE